MPSYGEWAGEAWQIETDHVVLTLKSVDEILTFGHSNESYWAVLSCGAVYYDVQGGSTFWVWVWNPKVWPFKWKLLISIFLWCCLLRCTRYYYEILRYNIEMKATAWTALSCGSVYQANRRRSNFCTVLSYGAVYYDQQGTTFEYVDESNAIV